MSAQRLDLNDGMDAVVLNSVANLGKAIPSLSEYAGLHCYLDNDVAGRAALARLQREFGAKVIDKSALYPNCKDMNEYLLSLQPKQTTKFQIKH